MTQAAEFQAVDSGGEQTRSRFSARSVVNFAIFGAACILVAQAYRLFGFTHDDAFITYRYAWNVAHGHGPVFNPGERVEGYSCPLYLVITSLFMWIPGDPLFRAKLFGIVCALLTLVVSRRLASRCGFSPLAQLSLPVLIALNSSVALSAVDGMETSLQMLLVTLAAERILFELQQGELRWSGLFLALAALNRPEGILHVVAVGIGVVVVQRLQHRPVALRWVAGLAAPVIALLAWRFAYYGDLLPNTYYAKNVGWEEGLEKGIPYLLRTICVDLNEQIVPALIGATLWLAALVGLGTHLLRRRYGWLLAVLIASQCAFVLRSSGDWMPGWRYMAAVVPLFSLLVIAAFDGLPSVEKIRSRIVTGGALGFAALCILVAPAFRMPKEGAVSWSEKGFATSARGLLTGFRMENTVLTADALKDWIAPGSIVAFSEMGALPFLTPDLRYLDTYGLVDRQIARLPDAQHSRAGVEGDYTDSQTVKGAHLLARKPDYVIRWLMTGSPPTTILSGNYQLFQSRRLKDFDGHSDTLLCVWKRVGPAK